MNNYTSGRAPRRTSEMTNILTLQILGLITRDGQGPFVPTEKMHRLQAAHRKEVAGEELTLDERQLLTEFINATTKQGAHS